MLQNQNEKMAGNFDLFVRLLTANSVILNLFDLSHKKKLPFLQIFRSPDGLSLHNDSETLPDWNLDAERKRRIWKPFWNVRMNRLILDVVDFLFCDRLICLVSTPSLFTENIERRQRFVGLFG